MKKSRLLGAVCSFLNNFRPSRSLVFIGSMFFAAYVNAATVAIVQGSFYTTNLRDNLLAQGLTVTEITSYTAASLSAFDSVIHYGNSVADTAALTTYVSAGGNLVLTPWSGLNFTVPTELQIFDNGGVASFSEPYPGINILDAAHQLLSGVSFPAGTGGFNIGRITGIGFVGGASQVAEWNDGVAMLGQKTFGLGTVTGVNMHVITSDTAFDVIDQPWATQLFVNAVSATVVPIPAAMWLFGSGLLGLIGISRRKRLQQTGVRSQFSLI